MYFSVMYIDYVYIAKRSSARWS